MTAFPSDCKQKERPTAQVLLPSWRCAHHRRGFPLSSVSKSSNRPLPLSSHRRRPVAPGVSTQVHEGTALLTTIPLGAVKPRDATTHGSDCACTAPTPARRMATNNRNSLCFILTSFQFLAKLRGC